MRKGYPFLFCLFSLPLCTCAADNPPVWVKEIPARSVPVFDGKVPAIVLLDEQHATVDATGKVTIAFRRALKILNQEGRKEAEAVIPYLSGSVKVKELHAWLIAPSGYVKTFGKHRVQDIGAVTEALYDELRIRAVHAKEPEIGSVFAYEAELERTKIGRAHV